MHELISGNKIILSKKFSAGSSFIIEMPGNMYAVLGFVSVDEEPIYSRVFLFSDKSKKEILKKAKKSYNDVKNCLNSKRLDLLETLDC